MKNKIFVYIATPYTSNQEKGVKAQIALASSFIDNGMIPIWPLSGHYVDKYKEKDWKTWILNDMITIIKSADIFFRVSGESIGADIEEKLCFLCRIPRLGVSVNYEKNSFAYLEYNLKRIPLILKDFRDKYEKFLTIRFMLKIKKQFFLLWNKRKINNLFKEVLNMNWPEGGPNK